MLDSILEMVVYKILWTGLKCEVNTKILDKCIGIINLVSQNDKTNNTVRKHGVDCWATVSPLEDFQGCCCCPSFCFIWHIIG